MPTFIICHSSFIFVHSMVGLHEPPDRYSRGETVLHGLDARLKLLLALAASVAFSFTPPTFLPAPEGVTMSLVHVFGLLTLCVLIVWAGIPVGYVLGRLLVIVPILAAIALSIPFGRRFDAESWAMMAQVVLRGTLCKQKKHKHKITTPIESLLAAMRRRGGP